MLSEETLQALQCAMSSDSHFVKQPLSLSCGHSVCKKCVPATEKKQLKCKLCGEINQIELDKLSESRAIKQLLKAHFDQLFDIIVARFETSLTNLRDGKKTVDEHIDEQIRHAKNEINSRIQLIKDQLDRLNELFGIELDKGKHELVKAIDMEKIDPREYENLLIELKSENRRHLHKNEESFYLCQEKIQEMNDIIDDLHNFNNEVFFRPSEETIEPTSIGEIHYNYRSLGHIKDLSALHRIKVGKYKAISTKVRPTDICLLSNGYLLAANCKDCNLTVYDANIKAVRTVDKINYQPFRPVSVACQNDKIYICDIANHRVIRTDLEFRRNGLFGSQGFAMNNLNHPHGLCIYKNFVYVCDSYNNRIQKLTSRLYFEQSIILDYEPWQIKIANDIACIRALNVASIFFYDLKTFTMKYEFNGHNGVIGDINGCFYEYYTQNNTIYFYDNKGELYEEIITDGFATNKNDVFGGITVFMGKVALSFEDSKKLIFI